MSAPDHANDPEIKARYEIHKVKRTRKGLDPLPFKSWLDFYLQGKAGGKLSNNDKAAAGRKSAKVRKQKRKLAAVAA